MTLVDQENASWERPGPLPLYSDAVTKRLGFDIRKGILSRLSLLFQFLAAAPTCMLTTRVGVRLAAEGRRKDHVPFQLSVTRR